MIVKKIVLVYLLINLDFIKGFVWLNEKHLVNIATVNKFVGTTRNECPLRCFEKRHFENFKLKLIQYNKTSSVCECHDGDIDQVEKNVYYSSLVIDESYAGIGKSLNQIDLYDKIVKVGIPYKAELHQLIYSPSDTAVEVFGIDDVTFPTNISIRLEFPFVDSILNKYGNNGRAERIYPIVRFFANRFVLTTVTQYYKAIHRIFKFNYMVTDMKITTNKTWMVLLTYNEEVITISMKAIDIAIQPKYAVLNQRSEINYINTTAMQIKHEVSPDRRSTTDMLNSYLFIESDSNVKLIFEKSLIMQPKSVSTELDNRRIVIKLDSLLLVDNYFTFFIVKDIKEILSVPRKSSVRLTLIYKGYKNGISSQQTRLMNFNVPLINDGNIQGFYLVNPVTGFCIEPVGAHLVYGFRCAKFQVYHSTLYDEYGKCVYATSDGWGGQKYILNPCTKRKSNAEKATKISKGYPNLNLYKFFHGNNQARYRSSRILQDPNITNDFQPIYTNFGWTFDKTKDRVQVVNNNVITGKTASYVDGNKNIYFSLSYYNNTKKEGFYISNGFIKKSETLIILKKFDKRLHRIGILQDGMTETKDLFGNIAYCNANDFCTIKSKASAYVENFIKTSRDYNISVNEPTQEISYFRILNKAKNNTVVMPRSIDCEYHVGKSKLTAMQSCKKIKEYCQAAKSGYYWIGGEAMEIFHEAYCEMETDEVYLSRFDV